jgi:hypothetical protein
LPSVVALVKGERAPTLESLKSVAHSRAQRGVGASFILKPALLQNHFECPAIDCRYLRSQSIDKGTGAE